MHDHGPIKASKEGAPFRGRLFFALLALAFLPVPAYAADRPNIVVVMADDHAQWALGAYGLEQIDTPNIDYLAEQGILFENAMTPAPVCSSARASFYTGKIPSQHGVHDFLSESEDFDADWLAGEKLLSERLQELGYRTALFGKWHATTSSKEAQPGFDRWLSYDTQKAGWRNQYLHSGTVHFSDGDEEFSHTGIQARFLTEQAIHFIDESSAAPFFVSLNFVEPHAPFDGLPERLVSRYRHVVNDIVRAGGASDLPARGAATSTPPDHVEQLAQYLAAISLIDEQVGRLLDALQGRGLMDNTMIVYTSDHGMLMGQYGLYGKTNATNPPNFYEETIRIPLVIHAPGEEIRRQQSRGEFVDLLDLNVTILDFASGGAITATDYGPGDSFRALLNGERIPWRNVQHAERGNARMASDGRWKLVRQYQKDPAAKPVDTWYDLAHPLGERFSVEPPREAAQKRLTDGMDWFFGKYETEEHSGRFIWNQPPPNARMRDDLSN